MNDCKSNRSSKPAGRGWVSKFSTQIGVALLLGTVCGPAVAQWRVIHAEPDYFVEFDPAAVREQPPLVLAWTRVTYTEARTEAEQSYQSQGQLHAIDCAKHASTVIGMVNYSGAFGQGDIGERKTRARAEWNTKSPPPDSLAALIINLACGEGKKP